MRWLAKVAAFHTLSALPGGEFVYRVLQQHVTRGTVPTTGTVAQKMSVAHDYLNRVRQASPSVPLEHVVHVDLGAGWMPTIPLVLYAAGIERQLLCDIRPNLHRSVVAQTVAVFRDLVSEGSLERSWGLVRTPPRVDDGDTLYEYLERLGIRYVAPYEPEDLTSIDGWRLMTCTQVLLYLSPDELRDLFTHVARALATGGLFVATVHLYDLYSDFDPHLSPYNKWRYSDFTWEHLVNCRLMSFNRLTAGDYRELAENSGLEILDFEVEAPTAAHLAALRNVRIHRRFRETPERDLAARHLMFTARSGSAP